MDIRLIWDNDSQGRVQAEALLRQEGISLDQHLDYTLGLYEEDQLLATGSFYRNTLRCLAVDREHQGEGLMAMLVSQLSQELFSRGVYELFIHTKAEAAKTFTALGFYEIASVDEVVFLENRKHGFERYLEGLERPQLLQGVRIGAIVMNANPFSLGHQYLAEQAAANCQALHLFMVSEDVSLFPYAVREKLIRAGTAHIPHIYYHPTGPYLVSSATFPSYFIKESDALTLAQARLDAAVFGRIAQALAITDRFVGEEPFSPSTALYNQAMSQRLPLSGVQLHILPRRQDTGQTPISATRVRAAMMSGDLDAIRHLVPQTTYDFLTSPEGQAIARKLRESDK